MYPSGKWIGYWDQAAYGRQPMEDLTLRFADGAVTGHGTDLIGPFVFRGSYDAEGNVALTKQYLGRHAVYYVGRYDGEGTIHGVWSIPPLWRGTFALSLERSAELATALAAEPIQDL